MNGHVPFDLRRASLYILAATGLAVVIGAIQQGSIGGGLVLGLAVGVGVAIGLVLFEMASRHLNI